MLDLVGALLLQQVPISFEGPKQLLATASSLAAAVLAGIALLVWLDHKPARTLGFDFSHRAARLSLIGLAIGAGALLLIALIELAAGWLSFAQDAGTPGDWMAALARDLVVLGIAAAAEEAIFRGYALQVLAAGTNATVAIVVSSIVFAWAHAQNPNVGTFALINIFLAGVTLGVAMLLTRSLWFVTAIHVGWNWCMASLVDLPVSGLEIFDTPLYEPATRGPVWFTGGSFGPEGGIAGTIAFAAMLGAVLMLHRRYSKAEFNG